SKVSIADELLKYKELLDASELETDVAKRAEFLLEAEQILVKDACLVAPTYTGKGETYVDKKVKGYYTNPSFGVDYSLMYIQK
ncbi:MAG: hypothetical protein RSE93_01250, partial [Oscillospiraceae bacterium]